MEDTERIAFLESNLARQLAWIAAADSKMSFVFAAAVAMLGVLAALAPTESHAWTTAAAVFVSFALAFSAASLVSLSAATFPRTKGPKGSMIYCGGIAQRSADQFLTAVKGLSREQYADDLAMQCHRNAEIADRKFAWVRRSLVCLFLAAPAWAFAVYLLYSGRM